MRALRYALGEALIGLRRAGRSTALSIGTVTVAFLTVGGFLLATTNIQQVVGRWASAAEMSVFLRDDVDDAGRTALISELSAHPVVAGVEYVSKEQARAGFESEFPELGDVAHTGTGNPFPASLELRLRTDSSASAAADVLAAELGARAGVADVRYDQRWLSRLDAVLNGIRLGGISIAAVLILGAAFTVAAVVRLSLFARRDEIEIMRLVGAPFSYIRGPSVAEGTLIGGAGAVVALVVLWVFFRIAVARWSDVLRDFGGLGSLQFLGLSESALVIVAALFVGGLTGRLVARQIR
jgi:cell division transport system permease protein